MTVRIEIAQSRGEVHGAKDNARRVWTPASGERAVSWHMEPRGCEGQACPPKARRSSESVIAAETFMDDAG
jgi:hypothetical protein